jgi:hypothetical protein
MNYFCEHTLNNNYCREASTVDFVQKDILVYRQSVATHLTTVKQVNINVPSLLPVYTLDLDIDGIPA